MDVNNQTKKIRSKSTNTDGDSTNNKENLLKIIRKYSERSTTNNRNPFASLQENVDSKLNEVVNNKIGQVPRRKTKLIKKFNLRQAVWTDCLYDDEYIEDNLKILEQKETEEIIALNLLKNCSTYRILTVDWFVYIHQTVGLLDTTLFTCVKNFDKILTIFQVSTTNYRLAAIVCLWITAKACDRGISMSTMMKICTNLYTISQIIATERRILQKLDFKLIKVEPCTILYYYLKQENLINNKLVIDYALFLLHCMLLLPEYSSTKPTNQAALALYISLLKFKIDSTSFKNYIYTKLVDQESFDLMVNELNGKIKEILKVKISCEWIIKKFSKIEYSNIVQQFFNF